MVTSSTASGYHIIIDKIWHIFTSFLYFQIHETVYYILTWSHFVEVLESDSDLEISFFTKQCEIETNP